MDGRAGPDEPALAGREPPAVAAGTAGDDAPLLLQALRQRLALAAGDAGDGDDAATRLRATVLECVADLGSLHQTMRDAAARSRMLERRIAGLLAALAALRAELAGRPAGERVWRRWAMDDSPPRRPAEPATALLRACGDLTPREAPPAPR